MTQNEWPSTHPGGDRRMNEVVFPCCPFLVFSGLTSVRRPGWEDFRGVATTLSAAHALLEDCRAYGLDWYQIVDLRSLEVVEHGGRADAEERGA